MQKLIIYFLTITILGPLQAISQNLNEDITTAETPKSVFLERALTLEELSQAILEYNRSQELNNSHRTKITSFERYQVFYPDISFKARSFEEYQEHYGITKEEFIKSIFNNDNYLSLIELREALIEYDELIDRMGLRFLSVRTYNRKHVYIEGALSLDTYWTLYNIEGDKVSSMLNILKVPNKRLTELLQEGKCRLQGGMCLPSVNISSKQNYPEIRKNYPTRRYSTRSNCVGYRSPGNPNARGIRNCNNHRRPFTRRPVW